MKVEKTIASIVAIRKSLIKIFLQREVARKRGTSKTRCSHLRIGSSRESEKRRTAVEARGCGESECMYGERVDFVLVFSS